MKEFKITGISCDSRKVKPGYAFVAIKGMKEDGNNYIDDAVKKGASVIITDRKCGEKSIPVVKVKDARAYLGELASAFYNYPSQKLNLIGVTGTNGKTTTTHLIYNLLNYNKKISGLIGTVKVDTGQNIKNGKLTTPQPVDLQKDLHSMVENKLKYCCMEVSSHGIKLKRIKHVDFAIKVGTNITLDHYDLHSNFTDYIQVKKSFLTTKDKNIPVLLNKDDTWLIKFEDYIANPLYYSVKTQAPITAHNIKYKNNFTVFDYELNKKLITSAYKPGPCKFKIKMLMPGIHNIYNALVAITISLYYGIKPREIKEFFKNYQGVWRRLEAVYNKEFTILDDCAHNPGSYRAVFQTIKKMNYNHIYIINSLRGNRGQKINRENSREISQQLADFSNYSLFITNCSDTASKLDTVLPEEEDAFLSTLEKNKIPYKHFYYLKTALKAALNKINKDDLLLLLGPHAMDNASEMALSLIKKDNFIQL